MLTVFTCFVAIITGLFCTLVLLAIFRKALPALPISIGFGVMFYFLTRIFFMPFIVTLQMAQVFI
ncbi:presenilin family protein [Pelomyxa schiedti]|nr:presenilin family protein [Pelomyxa schiedti]